MQRVTAGNVVLLDVREPTEWETHIAGALQIPRGILEAKADPTSPRHDPALDPGKQVIVYCRSGARSALAAVTLDGARLHRRRQPRRRHHRLERSRAAHRRRPRRHLTPEPLTRES